MGFCKVIHVVVNYTVELVTYEIGYKDSFNCIYYLYRASDGVWQKMGNSVAFSREIMQQERSIMRQIMRFF